METQKMVILLNSPKNEYFKFATKKWYVMDSESNGGYSKDSPIKFLTKSIESSLCNYSDAYIVITGDIAVKRRNAADTADIALAAATQIVHHLKIVKQKSMTLLLIM